MTPETLNTAKHLEFTIRELDSRLKSLEGNDWGYLLDHVSPGTRTMLAARVRADLNAQMDEAKAALEAL